MNSTTPQALVLSLIAIGCAADETQMPVATTAAEVEQTTQGTRPPANLEADRIA